MRTCPFVDLKDGGLGKGVLVEPTGTGVDGRIHESGGETEFGVA